MLKKYIIKDDTINLPNLKHTANIAPKPKDGDRRPRYRDLTPSAFTISSKTRVADVYDIFVCSLIFATNSKSVSRVVKVVRVIVHQMKVIARQRVNEIQVIQSVNFNR